MIRLVFRCLLLITGTAHAAGNVLLVTDLEDDYLAFRPDLRLVAIDEKEGVNISLSVKLGLDALF